MNESTTFFSFFSPLLGHALFFFRFVSFVPREGRVGWNGMEGGG